MTLHYVAPFFSSVQYFTLCIQYVLEQKKTEEFETRAVNW